MVFIMLFLWWKSESGSCPGLWVRKTVKRHRDKSMETDRPAAISNTRDVLALFLCNLASNALSSDAALYATNCIKRVHAIFGTQPPKCYGAVIAACISQCESRYSRAHLSDALWALDQITRCAVAQMMRPCFPVMA